MKVDYVIAVAFTALFLFCLFGFVFNVGLAIAGETTDETASVIAITFCLSIATGWVTVSTWRFARKGY